VKKSNYFLKKALIEEIERAGEHMISLVLKEGFTSHNTILVSQFLDRLLNELDKISMAD